MKKETSQLFCEIDRESKNQLDLYCVKNNTHKKIVVNKLIQDFLLNEKKRNKEKVEIDKGALLSLIKSVDQLKIAI